MLPNEKGDVSLAFRHSRTKMVHYGHVEFADRTGCGRPLSEAYYVFSDDVESVYTHNARSVLVACRYDFGSLWTLDVRNVPIIRSPCLHEVCTINCTLSSCPWVSW